MNNLPTKRIAIVGGGIIGISSALRILETDFPKYNMQVEVFAENYTDKTTSAGAAGFFHPYLLGDVPESTLWLWCKKTYDFLLDLCMTADCECGVGLLPAYKISEEPMVTPSYSQIYLEYRDMTKKELQLFPKKYKFGKFMMTLFAECSKLLPYMMRRIEKKVGKLYEPFMERKINSLSEFIGSDYDVVINCSGLGALQFVPDPEVFPIRGQTIRIKAPWIKYAVMADEFYILPNSEETICGGTQQKGDFNTDNDDDDVNTIWKGCCNIIPSLQDAERVKEWAGLRPGRSKPRLEKKEIPNGKNKPLQVIHNYGHGGSGITVFWGCAEIVVIYLQEILQS